VWYGVCCGVRALCVGVGECVVGDVGVCMCVCLCRGVWVVVVYVYWGNV